MMIDFEKFAGLADMVLPDFQPKATSVEGSQREAYATLWGSADSTVSVGVWECTAGRFTSRKDTNAEMCYFLSGSVTIKTDGGSSQSFKAGDFLTLPQGWIGEWIVHEQVRKIYVVHYPAGK